MIHITVLLCLAALVLWPYIRIVLYRILALFKIKKSCRDNDVEFKLLNKAFAFSSNSKNNFDFLIYVGRTTVPVKFFSSLYRNDTIIFDAVGRICTVRRYREALSHDSEKKFRIKKSVKKMPDMKLNNRYIRAKGYCFPIFLNLPSTHKVLYKNEKGEVTGFYDGAHRVAGCNFMEIKTFLDLVSMYNEEVAYQQKSLK